MAYWENQASPSLSRSMLIYISNSSSSSGRLNEYARAAVITVHSEFRVVMCTQTVTYFSFFLRPPAKVVKNTTIICCWLIHELGGECLSSRTHRLCSGETRAHPFPATRAASSSTTLVAKGRGKVIRALSLVALRAALGSRMAAALEAAGAESMASTA